MSALQAMNFSLRSSPVSLLVDIGDHTQLPNSSKTVHDESRVGEGRRTKGSLPEYCIQAIRPKTQQKADLWFQRWKVGELEGVRTLLFLFLNIFLKPLGNFTGDTHGSTGRCYSDWEIVKQTNINLWSAIVVNVPRIMSRHRPSWG